MKNSEILTCHELKINKIDGNDEDEYDPIELWNTVQEVSTNLLILKIYNLYTSSFSAYSQHFLALILKVIHIVVGNLQILEINCNDIIGISITNQRETTLLWLVIIIIISFVD